MKKLILFMVSPMLFSAYSFCVTKSEGVFLEENFKPVKMSVRCVKSIGE